MGLGVTTCPSCEVNKWLKQKAKSAELSFNSLCVAYLIHDLYFHSLLMYPSHSRSLGFSLMIAANLYLCALMGLIMNTCPSRNAYLRSK